MSNKRIYEVAADYGKPVNEVLDLLKKNNLDKKNFSGADEQVMAVIRKAYDKKHMIKSLSRLRPLPSRRKSRSSLVKGRP